jgi:hypothetical protein
VSHTPGPWSVGEWDDRTNGWSINAPSGIASALYLGGTAPAKANARLIAAAPELLAALEEITRYYSALRHAYPGSGDELVEQKAIAAIKKAGGV